MKQMIKNGYSACAGVCASGWYGGALVLDGRDKEFVKIPGELSYEQRAAYARRWSELTINPSREILLVLPEGDGMMTRCIASAERLEGPVAPREQVEVPTLAWIERRKGQWHLVVFEHDEVRTVLTRNAVMRCLRIASTAGGLVFAFETDVGPHATQVEVADAKGMILHKSSGREPVLCAAGDGFVLCSERYSPNEVILRLETFASVGKGSAQVIELKEGDYLLNAGMAWSGQELFIAAESSPCWGYSNQIGLHRTIHTWQWDLKGDAVALGQLPVEQRAFKSLGVENIAPIRPSVLIEEGKPVVGFKQHRFTGFRAFEWDLFLCRREREHWAEPVRVSLDPTLPDSTFGLVLQAGSYVGLIPTHENEGGKDSKQSEDHRIDLVKFALDYRLDRVEIPDDKKAEYRMPIPCKDVALDPPLLTSPYEGRQLIWGDMHIHSIYSKCVGAVDGSPRENIRFARDVLGCRVFAIAEHTPHTTGIESTWLFDQLESTAGSENVVLYATEPGIRGTRHMNLYSRDRATFERLERIMLSQDRVYQNILRQLRDDLPHDSIYIMRHVHGNAIPDAQIPQHFDPHFEVAMEAMQGRGNAMLGEFEKSSKFPNSFLDAGCKVGLVGGTDHFREWTPNHFCLTGFWVKEVSADGVWEAIRNRYTIAMSDSRVAMVTRCKGAPMGETVTLAADESMKVSVEASCAHKIRRITLMRDGELLPWMDVDEKTVATDLVDENVAPGKHWYVVTAEVDTGHGSDNTGICHASPYFVWKKPERRPEG